MGKHLREEKERGRKGLRAERGNGSQQRKGGKNLRGEGGKGTIPKGRK